MPKQPRSIPVVVHLTPEEHAALLEFVSNIRNDGATPPSVARYMIVDYLASELGADLDVPGISG